MNKPAVIKPRIKKGHETMADGSTAHRLLPTPPFSAMSRAAQRSHTRMLKKLGVCGQKVSGTAQAAEEYVSATKELLGPALAAEGVQLAAALQDYARRVDVCLLTILAEEERSVRSARGGTRIEDPRCKRPATGRTPAFAEFGQ